MTTIELLRLNFHHKLTNNLRNAFHVPPVADAIYNGSIFDTHILNIRYVLSGSLRNESH